MKKSKFPLCKSKKQPKKELSYRERYEWWAVEDTESGFVRSFVFFSFVDSKFRFQVICSTFRGSDGGKRWMEGKKAERRQKTKAR